MPDWLSTRNIHLHEQMDAADCDPARLVQTYAHFSHINKFFCGWDSIFDRFIAPVCNDVHSTYTLLDVGCGGGDIAVRLLEKARQHQIRLQITAIDTDPRAIRFAEQQMIADEVSFHCASVQSLKEEGRVFDFVISNHVLHHLNDHDVRELCLAADQLARRRVIFNDLSRSRVAWILFYLFTLGRFRDSFIREDGLSSIRRSYTRNELRSLVPPSWHVMSMCPSRLVAIRL